jgi:hypothetical protein
VHQVALGGLMVACVPVDPRFSGLNPAKDNEFLKAIKMKTPNQNSSER